MIGDDHHVDDDGLEEAPLDVVHMVHFHHVADGVPAVVAGRNDHLGTGFADLLQLHVQALVTLRAELADAVEAASAALSGEAPFYGLQAVDSDLLAFPAHQSLLKAYEKLQRAKAVFWGK